MSPAPWDRTISGRRVPAAGTALRAALPALKNGKMGSPTHCGSSRAPAAAGYQIIVRRICVLAPRQS